MTNEEKELMPCPFCGGEAVHLHTKVKSNYDATIMLDYDEVKCRSCGASAGYACDNAQHSIKAWNTRATTTKQPDIAEKLVEELKLAKETVRSLFKQKGDVMDENQRLKDQLAGARGIHKQIKAENDKLRAATPTDEMVRDAAYMLREWKHEIKCEGFSSYVETLIKAAAQPQQPAVSSKVVESMKEMYQLVEVLDAQLSKITGGNTIYSAILDRAEKALSLLEKNRVGG